MNAEVPFMEEPAVSAEDHNNLGKKLVCMCLITVGLTLTGYFIYQGSQIGRKNQYSFAIVIQLTYAVVYPILMTIINPSWDSFRRQLNDLGIHRAILCGLLWSLNNVLITVPAAHLSGFYQTMGIGLSFIWCYLIEKAVQGTKYTKTQSVCVFGCLTTFALSAAFDGNLKLSWDMIYWLFCYTLNQAAANYAQVLMENSWALSDGNMLYKVCHGNFVTNLCGLPFFILSLPFYYSQDECVALENLWIPLAIAASAIVYTLGSNVLMQLEDMTYSMMAGTFTNITTLILITEIDWNKGSASAEEILSYCIVVSISTVYMCQSSNHSGTGNEFLRASKRIDAGKIILLVSCVACGVALASGYA